MELDQADTTNSTDFTELTQDFESRKLNKIFKSPLLTPGKTQQVGCETTNELLSISDDNNNSITKSKVTFDQENLSQLNVSQQSEPCSYQSKYECVLSQRPARLSHRQALQWLQERRAVGLWAQCARARCGKWRYLPQTHDPLDLPDIWHCQDNPDVHYNECSAAQARTDVAAEEDLVHGEYGAGSLVWARLPGYPWWPAMVDDCPDTEQYYWLDGFSDIPTNYNVVFFDDVHFGATRSWITPKNLKPFVKNINKIQVNKQYLSRINYAKEMANEASTLPILQRLKKFSFIARYNGAINTPKKVKKTHKRKAHSLDSYSSTDSEECTNKRSFPENKIQGEKNERTLPSDDPIDNATTA